MKFGRQISEIFSLCVFVLSAAHPCAAAAAVFTDKNTEPFGTYDGVQFERHSGRFQGSTTLGAYDVPFEIVAPADIAEGGGALLFEAPHFFFGPLGRDFILGRPLVFERGMSYASVGWAGHGLSILDPSAAPIILAGEEVENPGEFNPVSAHDFELIVQFVAALKLDPYATRILGHDPFFYAFGLSQTSSALLQILLGPDGPGLFDLNVFALQFWPAIFGSDVFDRLNGDFVSPPGIGRALIVNTEGELILSDAEQFRTTSGNPDYRVYEVSGAPHFPLPPPLNPLDYSPVIRAVFAAGDDWIRRGIEPPADAFISTAIGVDPIYGLETGVARDFNGNALGGIRLPEVAVGQAIYIASLLDLEILPGLPGLAGAIIDLSCVPLSDGSARFPSHGQYVSGYAQQAHMLRNQRYLLPSDAELLTELASESDVGKSGYCN